MARWIALGVTLLCLGSCSFMSLNTFRGMIAPVGVVIGSIITAFLFVQARIEANARPEAIVVMDPKTQEALKHKAAARKVEELKAKLAQQTGQRPGGSPDVHE